MRLSPLWTDLMYYILNIINKFSHQTRRIRVLFFFLMWYVDVYCFFDSSGFCCFSRLLSTLLFSVRTNPFGPKLVLRVSVHSEHWRFSQIPFLESYQPCHQGQGKNLEFWAYWPYIAQHEGSNNTKTGLEGGVNFSGRSPPKKPLGGWEENILKCSFYVVAGGDSSQEFPGSVSTIETAWSYLHFYLGCPKLRTWDMVSLKAQMSWWW